MSAELNLLEVTSAPSRRWKPYPAYKDSGLYDARLDKYERREDEESPLGLILCAEKTAEHVELLQLETCGYG